MHSWIRPIGICSAGENILLAFLFKLKGPSEPDTALKGDSVNDVRRERVTRNPQRVEASPFFIGVNQIIILGLAQHTSAHKLGNRSEYMLVNCLNLIN